MKTNFTYIDTLKDHVGERVRVRGVLVNQGKNYFTDRRVGLRGEGGAFVAVRPWLPLELPPARPDQKPSERELLSDYLDQQIEIVGTLERGSIKGMGNVIHLNVESAVRIDSKKE